MYLGKAGGTDGFLIFLQECGQGWLGAAAEMHCSSDAGSIQEIMDLVPGPLVHAKGMHPRSWLMDREGVRGH